MIASWVQGIISYHSNLLEWCIYFWTFLNTIKCRWFSPGIPVSSANKTDHHDITEMLSKVAWNTIPYPHQTITIPKTLCLYKCIYIFIPIIQSINRWFSPDTPVSSINKTYRQEITEILLKVVLNSISQNQYIKNIQKWERGMTIETTPVKYELDKSRNHENTNQH